MYLCLSVRPVGPLLHIADCPSYLPSITAALAVSLSFSSSKRVCRQWENHSHTEFITAVVAQNHGYNFNNCGPQLSKQLHWNLIPVDFSFILCQGRILIRSAKTTGVTTLMNVRQMRGRAGKCHGCALDTKEREKKILRPRIEPTVQHWSLF